MLQLDTGSGRILPAWETSRTRHARRRKPVSGPCGSQKPGTTLSCPWRLRLNIPNAYAWGLPWRLPSRAVPWCWPTSAGTWRSFPEDALCLGLGTQVKGHNERRFSVPWVPPGPRLRDMVLAIRAIWDCWQHGTRLDFRSRHYTHTLMTPFFNPGPIEHPDIPILLGGVNPYMCRIAGEVADGLLMHSLNSVTYIRTVVLPAVLRGVTKKWTSPQGVYIAWHRLPGARRHQEELDLARATVRQRIAFYASTRTYKTVLEAHGWGDLTDRLHAMAGRGAWEAMGREITDDMLDAFCIISTPAMLGQKLRGRFDGLVDRLFLNLTYEPAAKKIDWPRLIQELAA